MSMTAETVAAHFATLARSRPCACGVHGPVDETTDSGLDPGPWRPTPPLPGRDAARWTPDLLDEE